MRECHSLDEAEHRAVVRVEEMVIGDRRQTVEWVASEVGIFVELFF